MFGLDDAIAHVSNGGSFALVLLAAIVLGLRHATDPDHLAAVTTLVASGERRSRHTAGLLGLSWGLGHATTLFLFGLPIVLYDAYLPAAVQRGAEMLVGVVIMGLAVWLLVRWRRGVFHPHLHAQPRAVRTRLQAYGIGLVHGLGGSAGLGVLLLATIDDRALAILAMALFAVFTAISMAGASLGLGTALGAAPIRRSFHRVAPGLGVISLAFGAWYALGALALAPYSF
jgi:high-affinity nickel permease